MNANTMEWKEDLKIIRKYSNFSKLLDRIDLTYDLTHSNTNMLDKNIYKSYEVINYKELFEAVISFLTTKNKEQIENCKVRKLIKKYNTKARSIEILKSELVNELIITAYNLLEANIKDNSSFEDINYYCNYLFLHNLLFDENNSDKFENHICQKIYDKYIEIYYTLLKKNFNLKEYIEKLQYLQSINSNYKIPKNNNIIIRQFNILEKNIIVNLTSEHIKNTKPFITVSELNQIENKYNTSVENFKIYNRILLNVELDYIFTKNLSIVINIVNKEQDFEKYISSFTDFKIKNISNIMENKTMIGQNTHKGGYYKVGDLYNQNTI